MSCAIEDYVRTQACGALQHCADRIEAVNVCLREVSGALGPEEYKVAFCLVLRELPRVVVEGHGCDVYVTSRYVATRARRALDRAIAQADDNDRQMLDCAANGGAKKSPALGGAFLSSALKR